jgi:CP family cyanate transporter-like MFS transporter
MSLLLVLLAVGEAMRAFAFTTPVLFASIVVVGVGAGAASTIVPALLVEQVPLRRGLVTGFFAAGLALGVGVAAVTAAPLVQLLGQWRLASAVWTAFMLGTLLLLKWAIPRSSRRTGGGCTGERGFRVSLRAPTLWPVVVYVSSPIIVGFTTIAWVGHFFIDLGLTLQAAATRLFVFQVMQLVSMTAMPMVADRLRDLRPLVSLPVCCVGVGIVSLLAAPLGSDPYAVAVLGLGVGGSTALGIAPISLVSENEHVASSVGGVVFTCAFALSAVWPVAVGVCTTEPAVTRPASSCSWL